jgi:hypothetical protein
LAKIEVPECGVSSGTLLIFFRDRSPGFVWIEQLHLVELVNLGACSAKGTLSLIGLATLPSEHVFYMFPLRRNNSNCNSRQVCSLLSSFESPKV